MLTRYFVAICLALINCSSVFSQTINTQPGPTTICPPGPFTGHHYIPVPPDIANKILMKGGGQPCSTIQVTYNGFTPAAQAAFQAAVDIWSYSISSPVTIRVNATWEALGENVLGSAGPSFVFNNFPNAPDNSYYASALADAIAGTDQSPGDEDIVASFNSDFDWYLGTDGNTPNNKYDLVSVVLHELGHGLGFISSGSYNETGSTGTYGLGGADLPLRFDHFMILGANGPSMLTLAEGPALGTAFTSNNVFCNSGEATTANNSVRPKIYAPSNYAPGSSLSHWNEITFPSGNPQSLMTPQLGPGEAIHSPGTVTLGLFADLGWTICSGSVNQEGCITWVNPSPTTGWNNFNTMFGGAPCDDGTGCPFNEIQDFEVFAGEAYGVDNFQSGGSYTFSICNGPGAGSWTADFTIIAPSGAIDAFGPGDGCSITWTASESGTYLIVISKDDECGVANAVGNGYPALTCEDGSTTCSEIGCSTEDLINVGESTLCPDQTTTVNLNTPASIPAGGGFGILFYNPTEDTGINLTDVSLPYTFNSDLNGLLTENGFDLFLGDYELTGFVYTDASNATGSICVMADNPINITFLSADDPACSAQESCNTESLILTGDPQICPGINTSVDLLTAATVPSSGGYGISFFNPALNDSLSLTDVELPYTFDNDLNGLLSANDLDPFQGEYELTGFVYTDTNNPIGSVCASSTTVVTINFLSPEDPGCSGPELCITGNLQIAGDPSICPGFTTIAALEIDATIPEGGGYGIRFFNPTTTEDINLTDVSLPYIFNNDLNGLLSANGIAPFIGDYELTGFVYSDLANPLGSICSTSDIPVIVTFYEANDPECITGIDKVSEQLDWSIYPNPTNTEFSVRINTAITGTLQIRLLDAVGRIVFTNETTALGESNTIQVPVGNLEKGMYSVVIENEKGRFVKKIVVQ